MKIKVNLKTQSIRIKKLQLMMPIAANDRETFDVRNKT